MHYVSYIYSAVYASVLIYSNTVTKSYIVIINVVIDIRKALNQTEAIMKNVHDRQHQWFGQVLHMDTNRIANTTLHGRVEGPAKRGRLRITWMSSVLVRYDVGPQALRRFVRDRDRWNLALTHGRAHDEVLYCDY